MDGILRASAATYPEIEFLPTAASMGEFLRVLQNQHVDVAIIGITERGLPAGYEEAAERYTHLRVLGIDNDAVAVVSFERCLVARPLPGELSADFVMRLILGPGRGDP